MKERKKTTQHLPKAHSRCRVGSLLAFFYLVPCFCTFFRPIPTWNEVLQKRYMYFPGEHHDSSSTHSGWCIGCCRILGLYYHAILYMFVHVYNIGWGGSQYRNLDWVEDRGKAEVFMSRFFPYWPTPRSVLYLLCRHTGETTILKCLRVCSANGRRLVLHTNVPPWISLANATQNCQQPKPVYNKCSVHSSLLWMASANATHNRQQPKPVFTPLTCLLSIRLLIHEFDYLDKYIIY